LIFTLEYFTFFPFFLAGDRKLFKLSREAFSINSSKLFDSFILSTDSRSTISGFDLDKLYFIWIYLWASVRASSLWNSVFSALVGLFPLATLSLNGTLIKCQYVHNISAFS